MINRPVAVHGFQIEPGTADGLGLAMTGTDEAIIRLASCGRTVLRSRILHSPQSGADFAGRSA